MTSDQKFGPLRKGLLELCILNALYLWRKKNSGLTHLDFRLALIKEI